MTPTESSLGGGYKVAKLGGFDFACRINKCHPIAPSVLAYRKRASMAPEIEAGLAHDASADVWSLGQLAYQLLSWQPKCKKPSFLVKDEPGNWQEQVQDDVKDLVQ